ncbi:hypothetical protein TcWFU_010356 [Taenia crassiceps]|uniref:Uncharacterized protein n=1 Tax=Taenia crassiceps TaxID=6207 RepID=A0ABR4QU45_9CEST
MCSLAKLPFHTTAKERYASFNALKLKRFTVCLRYDLVRSIAAKNWWGTQATCVTPIVKCESEILGLNFPRMEIL